MRRSILIPILLVLAPRALDSLAAESPVLGDLSKVGTVEFPTSCSAKAQPEFLRGVALLHSFFYEEARRVFTSAATLDPSCAMAHWGVAMTYYHPIWAPPTDDELKAGLEAISKAQAAGTVSERERDYIGALAAFYDAAKETATGPAGQSCHGPTDYRTRRAAFSQAMEKVHAKYPADVEAAAFYALSLILSSPKEEDLPIQLKAAGILEPLWKKNPNHPGLVHYLIHAYDYPSLAPKGLAAADQYASLAPWVPHALHMPSHIYTRLGMWQKSIDANLASSQAAREYSRKYHPDAANYNELHALDYLAYGYLQTAQDAKAREVADRLAKIARTYPEVDFAVAYAAGAIPARLVVERQAWQEAVSLAPPRQALVEKFPFDAAHVEFARALGRVRTADAPGARQAMAKMKELRDASSHPSATFFRRQLELQMLAVAGWIAWSESRHDEAIALLRYAADEEDALGKHPVSPGAIVPIRELLGDLYLELKRPDDALAAFERSLQINPGRYRATAGAALAAERAGKAETAREHYRRLLDLAKDGDGQRPEMARAKAFLQADSSRVTSR
ncbi:MAG TPA: tetratricopeptide repeat protein [Candidatus Polarisedimenticolia bacterium]|jgi:tetratricopeptide (TPR) repeat protein|nr:tetratricopeptide repeat protein [Candidatus Polarisedimenticolia bacterium]